ncbi:MAG: hydrogenase nickel incorporation protein HypB, partial [Actinomycetia bacterium]|nr:hydrogenase nickel incorporation protein HypB [Actinomycetes bacterium]
GAGKTSFILKTIYGLKDKYSIGVIEGDIASTVDAEKIKETKVPVIQINTGGACHLDANMISKSLGHFDLPEIDLMIIENVGNLVCPAEFNLGENLRVGILSIPEGDDKPQKYPLIFSEVDVLIINKIDLLELSNFQMEKVYSDVKALNNNIHIINVSCLKDIGVDEWLNWLKLEIEKYKEKC